MGSFLDNSNCSINLRQSNPTTLEQRGQLLCPVTNMVLEPVAALTRLGEFLLLTLDNATAAPVELLRYIPPQKHLHLLWVLFCLLNNHLNQKLLVQENQHSRQRSS